jgi:hypothetical protein
MVLLCALTRLKIVINSARGYFCYYKDSCLGLDATCLADIHGIMNAQTI